MFLVFAIVHTERDDNSEKDYNNKDKNDGTYSVGVLGASISGGVSVIPIFVER